MANSCNAQRFALVLPALRAALEQSNKRVAERQSSACTAAQTCHVAPTSSCSNHKVSCLCVLTAVCCSQLNLPLATAALRQRCEQNSCSEKLDAAHSVCDSHRLACGCSCLPQSAELLKSSYCGGNLQPHACSIAPAVCFLPGLTFARLLRRCCGVDKA
jgi:hypothetical protein